MVRYILLGKIANRDKEVITKVLSFNNFDLPSTKMMLKYVKKILSNSVNKIEVKKILGSINEGKGEYRLMYDADNIVYTVIKADSGYILPGTTKNVIAQIWVQQIQEDITPSQFASERDLN